MGPDYHAYAPPYTMTTMWYVALPLLLVTKDVIIPQGSNAAQRAYQVQKHHLPCAGAAGGI